MRQRFRRKSDTRSAMARGAQSGNGSSVLYYGGKPDYRATGRSFLQLFRISRHSPSGRNKTVWSPCGFCRHRKQRLAEQNRYRGAGKTGEILHMLSDAPHQIRKSSFPRTQNEAVPRIQVLRIRRQRHRHWEKHETDKTRFHRSRCKDAARIHIHSGRRLRREHKA